MASSRSLPELAHVISSCTNRIYDAYDDEGIPQPSFDVGADHFSGPFTPAIETSRVKLLEALDELRALIVGPAGHVFFLSFLIVSAVSHRCRVYIVCCPWLPLIPPSPLGFA